MPAHCRFLATSRRHALVKAGSNVIAIEEKVQRQHSQNAADHKGA
jgi:hypothetical protein